MDVLHYVFFTKMYSQEDGHSPLKCIHKKMDVLHYVFFTKMYSQEDGRSPLCILH
jgi:hypothetical protein